MPWPGSAEVVRTLNSSESGRLRPEELLARVGWTQHRQVTTEQLHAVGWDDDDVSYRVRRGRLHAVFTGVFSLGGPPRAGRERWMASVLTFGPRTLLAATPAALLYGWLRFPSPELFVLTPTKRAPRDGIRPIHHEQRPAWRFIDHIPVTGPERTILDCASTVRSDTAFRRIVRQAQVDEATTHARLVAFAALHRGARGVARLKRELADGPSPTRSTNEDRVLELIRHGGDPRINHKIGGDEFDLVYLEQRVIVEIDSPLHDSPAAAAHDAAKQARAEALGFTVYRLR